MSLLRCLLVCGTILLALEWGCADSSFKGTAPQKTAKEEVPQNNNSDDIESDEPVNEQETPTITVQNESEVEIKDDSIVLKDNSVDLTGKIIAEMGRDLFPKVDCVKSAEAAINICETGSASNPVSVALLDASGKVIAAKKEDNQTIAGSKYKGYGTCYVEDGSVHFQAMVQAYDSEPAVPLFEDKVVQCPAFQRCQTGIRRGTWVVLFSNVPRMSGWCSGKGIVTLPPLATRIRATLEFAFADDWGSRIKINNQIVWNDPTPPPYSGPGVREYYPNRDISNAFKAGDNIISMRGYDTMGVYCSAAFSAAIEYYAPECQDAKWISQCQSMGLSCDP